MRTCVEMVETSTALGLASREAASAVLASVVGPLDVPEEPEEPDELEELDDEPLALEPPDASCRAAPCCFELSVGEA